MSDLTYVTFQTARPKGDFPGAIEEGQFAVEGNVVLLYDMNGMQIAKQEIYPTLTPKQTASIMLKRRAGVRSSDFNRKINYGKHYY